MALFGLKLWENAFQMIPDISFSDVDKIVCLKFHFDVEGRNVGDRLKRVFPKFEAERSHPRGETAVQKFDFFGTPKLRTAEKSRG